VTAGGTRRRPSGCATLSLSLAGLPVGEAAKRKLDALMARPDARRPWEAAQREAQAAAAWTSRKSCKTRRSTRRPTRCSSRWPRRTPAPPPATRPPPPQGLRVRRRVHEADPEREIGSKAKSALSLARGYAKAGRKEQATKRYESVIADFRTDYAKTARAELQQLK
jgi:hypothetical protein